MQMFFLDISHNKKAYKIFDLDSRESLTNQDVVFYEDLYPISTLQLNNSISNPQFAVFPTFEYVQDTTET